VIVRNEIYLRCFGDSAHLTSIIMPVKKVPGSPYAVGGPQGNPVGFLLLLAQQVVQMEHRPPITLALVAGTPPAPALCVVE